MLEFKMPGHIISISNEIEYVKLKVTRVREIGGIPRTLYKNMELDISMAKAIKSVRHLTNLPDEVFYDIWKVQKGIE